MIVVGDGGDVVVGERATEMWMAITTVTVKRGSMYAAEHCFGVMAI